MQQTEEFFIVFSPTDNPDSQGDGFRLYAEDLGEAMTLANEYVSEGGSLHSFFEGRRIDRIYILPEAGGFPKLVWSKPN